MGYVRALWPPYVLLGLSLIASYHLFWLEPLVIIFLIDVTGRTRSYRKLESFKSVMKSCSRIDSIPYFPRMWDAYGKSFCGRNVVIAVFPLASWYYYNQGYRWYHLFPDGTFRMNSTLLKPAFWRNLLKG